MHTIKKIRYADRGLSEFMSQQAYTLLEWIEIHFSGVQKEFAAAQGVAPAQVTQWLKNNFIVVDNKLYSSRRELVINNRSLK